MYIVSGLKVLLFLLKSRCDKKYIHIGIISSSILLIPLSTQNKLLIILGYCIVMSVISVRLSGKLKALGLGHIYIKGSYIINTAYNTTCTDFYYSDWNYQHTTTHLMIKHKYSILFLLLLRLQWYLFTQDIWGLVLVY